MKNLLYIIGFFFSAMLFFSCEPNRAEDGDLLFGVVPPKEQPPVAAVKYLSEVTAETDGETQTIKYTYENNNLVAVNSDGEDAISYNLTYENGKIAKAIIKQDIEGTPSTTVLTMTYDNNVLTSAEGDVISETDGTLFYNTRTEFTYAGGKATGIKTIHSIENPDHLGTYLTILEIESDIAYNGKNVSDWKLATTTPESPIVIPTINILLSDYDDKKNPFASLPSAFSLLSAHYSTGNQSILGLSANNYGQAQIEGEVVKVLYAYDSDGYPTVADGGANGTITFKYQP